jgi:uncharacterized OsmC-like protein
MSTIEKAPLNGVDTPNLLGTINVVRDNPEAGKFQFRATNRWISGTHNQSTVSGFFGAGAEQHRESSWTFDADHPTVLVGADNGPTPVEYVLVALAACLTSGLANVAATRGVQLHEVTSHVEGDIDLRAIFGLTDEVRNGYEGIRITFDVKGDASDEVLAALVEQSKARSAVFDVLTNGVPVAVSVAS